MQLWRSRQQVATDLTLIYEDQVSSSNHRPESSSQTRAAPGSTAQLPVVLLQTLTGGPPTVIRLVTFPASEGYTEMAPSFYFRFHLLPFDRTSIALPTDVSLATPLAKSSVVTFKSEPVSVFALIFRYFRSNATAAFLYVDELNK